MAAVTEVLEATRVRRGGAPAVVWDDAISSYDALHQSAARVAGTLLASNVQRGDRVAVGLRNSPELVQAVLAVLRVGAVLVPLNPAYTAEEVTYIVSDAGARVAVVEADHASVLAQTRVPALQQIVTRDRLWTEAPATLPTVDAESAALIIYTSGTTGRPKGAVLTHRALLSNLLTVAAAWEWAPEDRLLLTLPCFHLHGLGLGILASLLIGSSIVLRRRFEAEAILSDLSHSAATMFFGVPTMYNRLVSLPDTAWHAADLQRMRLWVSGSAPLSAATFERFRERTGFALMDRYGMTECGFVLATPYAESRHPGVVGRPLPGISVRIVDPERADGGELVDVPAGVQGEIVIKGPNLFSGYWDRPEDTRRAFLGGYLRSGDLAVRDADGLFRIVGRSSVDIIKTRGFKVSAVEIEDCLQRHPAVQDVAVVGIPDADQGERVVAVITRRPGAMVTADELRVHTRLHLAPNKVPSRIVFVGEIPRAGPGKIRKKALIEQLRAIG
jgi:malonyl-CoA/methylmalonyl-CoA synthetase